MWQLKGLGEAKRDMKGIWCCQGLQLDCVYGSILPTVAGIGRSTPGDSIHIEFYVSGTNSLAWSQTEDASDAVMMGFWQDPFPMLVVTFHVPCC